MEDWRYENLKEDIKRLREDVQEVRGRTYKLESWQDFFPLRVLMVVVWMVTIGIWVAAIAEAISRSH